MTLEMKIKYAEDIRQHISGHVEKIWPDFITFPFILYDGDNQVAVGDKWPARFRRERGDIWVAEGLDSALMGNTATKYGGQIVAIWDTRTWGDSISTTQAAAGIAHEMFHAYQEINMNLPFANELLLPQYPHSPHSVALVLEENKLFAEMLKNPASVMGYLYEITALRKQREEEIGADFMKYDERLEDIEGTAAYVEMQMQAVLEGITPAEAAEENYLPILAANNQLLTNYRHRCYTTGLILCLAADMACPGWKADWPKSGLTLFAWIKENLTNKNIAIKEAETMLSVYNGEKERQIAEFMSQPLTLMEGTIQLLSFDPMNLVCIEGKCLHAHGKISHDGAEQMFDRPFLAEYGSNIMDIKRIYLHAL